MVAIAGVGKVEPAEPDGATRKSISLDEAVERLGISHTQYVLVRYEPGVTAVTDENLLFVRSGAHGKYPQKARVFAAELRKRG